MIKNYGLNGVKLFRFGIPIKTDATVISLEKQEDLSQNVFKCNFFEEQCLIKYELKRNDMVIGFGETVRGLNKIGAVIRSFCSDDSKHLPDKTSLYGAHNFFIIDGEVSIGVFIDFPGEIIYDVGFSNKDDFSIDIKGKDFDFYVIEGNSAKEITEKFHKLIGMGYVPPKWGFGYQQSRWSYMDRKEIEELGRKFLDKEIPCDAIYLDIDYMENFKDFTIDNEKFCKFKEFVKTMKEMGIRLVPIIDAGVKIEKDYEIYDEGIANGYFCTNDQGKPFVAAVWPGLVHFPDFLNSNAREWFGSKYKILTDLGIEGFWNDMNEPAIFYSEKTLGNLFSKIENVKDKELNIYSFFDLMETFDGVSNSMTDYKSFFHNMDGELVRHDKVHNLYGYNMTRSAAEGLKKIDDDKRFLLFSRASYIGMHRYSGIWMGDNHSWWEHLLLAMRMLPAINMCGFLYSGPDTGGFGGNSNSELLIRWNQFSIFAPLYRNHSALGTRRQEPFEYDYETESILKNIIDLRYALIPYIYSEYMKSVLNQKVYCSYLLFEYNDNRSRDIEDQLLIGESIMITPIYTPNTSGRYVYFPEEMVFWKANEYGNRIYKVFQKGDFYIDVELEEVPIFIRKNKMIVIGNPAQNVESLDNTIINFIAFVENIAQYTFYDDDGATNEYNLEKNILLKVAIKNNETNYSIEMECKKFTQFNCINLDIVDILGNVLTVRLAKEDFIKNVDCDNVKTIINKRR